MRRALAHRRVEHRGTPASLRLGAVHRGTCVGKQVLHPGIRGRARSDADADGDGKFRSRNLEGPGDRLVDAAPDDLRGAVPGKIFEQHGELVGAQPREQVAFAQAGLQPLHHLDEDLVSALVPEPRVERPEPVHIDEQDPDSAALAAPRAREGAPEDVDEMGPVRQPRERVVQHADGGQVRVGDVHHRARQPQRLPRRIARGLRSRQHPAPASVVVPQPVFALESRRRAFEVRADALLHRIAVRGMDAIEPFRGRFAATFHADDGAPGIRQPEPIAGQVPVPDPVAGALPGERIAVRKRIPFLHQRRIADFAALLVVQRHDGPFAEDGLSRARRGFPDQLLGIAEGERLAQLRARLRARRVAVGKDQHRKLPPHRLRMRDSEEPLRRGVPGRHLPIRIAQHGRERSLIEQPGHGTRPGRNHARPLGLGLPLQEIGEERQRVLQGRPISIRAAVLLVDLAKQSAQMRRRLVLTQGPLELASEAPVHRQTGSPMTGKAAAEIARRFRRSLIRFRDERALSPVGASLRDRCANTRSRAYRTRSSVCNNCDNR